jgi:uncharacterized protein YbaR (Trm112 family)
VASVFIRTIRAAQSAIRNAHSMFIVLTDVLACPRCGPESGLIVLADRLEERRVLEGSLGCPNCRETYAISGGLPDLRYPPAPPPEPEELPVSERGRGFQLAALLGVTAGPGLILLSGDAAPLAGEIASIVPDIGVLATGEFVSVMRDEPAVNRLLIGDVLPLRSRTVRALALTGSVTDRLLDEGVRVLVPGGRMVLDPVPAGALQRLIEHGFSVLLQQDQIVVASASTGR